MSSDRLEPHSSCVAVTERLERELEARRDHDDLNSLLSGFGAPILLLGRDSRIRRFTPEAAELMNLVASDIGRPLSDIDSTLLVPDLLATVRDVLERAVPREHTITDASGRRFQLTVRPCATTAGKIEGAVLSIVDVDAIDRGEALVADVRDYADRIVNAIRDPLVVLGEDRHILSANRSFYELVGLTRSDVEGKCLDGLGVRCFSTPPIAAALERLAAGETVEDVRGELDSPRLGTRAVSLSGRPMARGSGSAHSSLLAFVDQTDQMKSDALVRRSERALREMLAAASESIVIAGSDGIITFANAMAARTFGYDPHELVGVSVDALVPEDLRAAHATNRAAFGAMPTGREMGANRELRGRRKNGSFFPIEVTLSTMEGEPGPLAVAFISDITERKQNEARIAKYKKNLQEMAFDSVIAEEKQRRQIATGLHDNIGQALALAQIRLTAARSKTGKAARADLDESMRLIAQAISDTRSLTFELSPPVLYDLGLSAAVGWLGEQLESQHGGRVAIESDAALEKLDDETSSLLFRAVRELLTNVVKHARTPAATVSLRRDGDSLAVVVEDQGTGFDPARIGRHEATETFGLFSVREQITRLGGAFDVVSGVDRGTKITLRVPIAKRAPPPASGGPR